MYPQALAKGCHSASSGGRRWLSALTTIMILACLGTMRLSAQYAASIQGVVTDPNGAVVPSATVTLTDKQTNLTLTSTTNGSGTYVFNALPPDHFRLTVARQGFQTKVLNDVAIIPEQSNALDVQLAVGNASETVTVSATQQPLLQTESASINGTISSDEIQHLPSFNRDVFQLVELAPGVFGDGSQASGGGTYNLPASNSGGSGVTDGIFKTENAPQIIANGGQNETNGISIDGVSTVSAVWGGTTVITPSEDSVQDVKVVSNNYDAEYGRFSAAQIQVVTKSGTNQIHGSFFFKGDRPGMNAYQSWNGPNAVSKTSGLLRDQSRFNQLGGGVGGPLWKNKLFAFFNYETLLNNTQTTAVNWYDTPQFDQLASSGSIASTFLTFPGAGVSSIGQASVTCATIGLTQGSTCNAVSGGLNIGSPLTSGLGHQDLTYVSSGQPGVGSGLSSVPDIGEYTTSSPSRVSEAQYNGRLDANVTSQDRASFIIYWVPVSTTSYNGPARAYNLYHHSAVNDAFTGLWDHTFSASLLNEARVNAAGWRWNEINDNPQEPFGLPEDSISGIGTISLQYFGAPGPSVFNQWTYGYQDVMTKVAGNHNIKFGGGVTRLYYLSEAPYNARPAYTFFNIWDFLNDAPEFESGTFNPLTGTPTINREDTREDLWAFFVQDDYKIRPNLTVNLGLRYSYFGPYSSKEGNLSTLFLGSGADTFTGMGLRLGGNLYNAQKGNFGPMVGFSYSPIQGSGRFVVRGGFGLNYNENEIAIMANGINNPPAVVSAAYSSPSPTQINPHILYAVPSDVHSLLGYPANPNTIVTYNSNNLPQTGTVSVTGFPANIPTTYVYHYSLDTQYALGRDRVATLGYQGSTGRHIITQYNAYVLGAAAGIPLNTAVTGVDYYTNNGNSNYNAMLATLRQQFFHGLMGEAEYTWGKSMDNGSQPYYEDPYPYNPKLAWGRSDYNIANAFKAYGVWQPTFFHGRHSWMEKVAGGWTLTGIFNVHTGFPWTPTYSNVPAGSLYFSGSGYGSLRPAAYLGGAGHNTSNKSFETGPGIRNTAPYNANYPLGALSYFTIPTFTPVTAPLPAEFPAPEAPGVSRNFLNGPNYRDVDASLAKAFGLPRTPVLGEAAQIEFRVDAFNLFNNVNLNGSSITTAISTNGVTSNPAFGQAQSALGSRTLDMQARFSF